MLRIEVLINFKLARRERVIVTLRCKYYTIQGQKNLSIYSFICCVMDAVKILTPYFLAGCESQSKGTERGLWDSPPQQGVAGNGRVKSPHILKMPCLGYPSLRGIISQVYSYTVGSHILRFFVWTFHL